MKPEYAENLETKFQGQYFPNIRIRNLFLLFYLCLFSVTAVSKLISFTLSGSYSNYNDPIFPFLTLEISGLLAAGIELVGCGIILRSLLSSYFYNQLTKGGNLVIACICSLFSIYRFGLWLVDYKKPCGCIGFINQLAQSELYLIDNFLWATLLVGIIGGVALNKTR